MWLVVDTNVLVDASGQGMREYAQASYELLRTLSEKPGFVLALDRKQKIWDEYQNRVRAPMFAYQWLEALRIQRRIEAVTGSGIPKGSVVELREAHFDRKDYPLVEAALYSEGTIVTRDFKSFTERVKTVLQRNLAIIVLSAAEVLQMLLEIERRTNRASPSG